MTLVPLDSDTITHGIQLAVAPVFLLTAVSGMIAAVAGRLARIIDRARVIEQRVRAAQDDAVVQGYLAELATLRRRGHLTNASIALLTTCAFLIGLTIILLFLGETTAFMSARWAIAGFVGGIACFLLALLCFLAETVIATRLLDFELLKR
jgi:hypothetical protein